MQKAKHLERTESYRAVARVVVISALAFSALAVPWKALAETRFENQKLTASDRAPDDNFGWSVSVDGDTALIGGMAKDDSGFRSGAVYVFKRTTIGVWTEQQKLTASDAPVLGFGRSVAVDGDTAVVGARSGPAGTFTDPSAYVFSRGADGMWREQQKLRASDVHVIGFSARSVAVDEDTIMIDAHEDLEKGASTGAVYVFVRNASGFWTEEQKLFASDAEEWDHFGWSIAIDGGTAIIGSNCDPDSTDSPGSIYIFRRDKDGVWREKQKLTPSDGAAGDQFGLSVAIDGSTAIIGSRSQEPGARPGSAYVLVRGKHGYWKEKQKLTTSDGSAGDVFSFSVDIVGNTILVGAQRDDERGPTTGAAYVFSRSKHNYWHEILQLEASHPEPYGFGGAVALDSHSAFVGAWAEGEQCDGCGFIGSAYVYNLKRKIDIDINIDIKPYNSQNKMNPSAGGTIWVAILSDNEFDPLQVKVWSARFGPDEAKPMRYRVRDVNRDGIADLMIKFKIRKTGIQCGDTGAKLKAKTYFGDRVTGWDSIETVGCKKHGQSKLEVRVDIKPWKKENKVYPHAGGNISVAILSNTDVSSPLDPSSQVDIASVRFGPEDAKVRWYKTSDIDRDGLSDLLLIFKMHQTGIRCGDTEASLTGETFDGQRFTGTDAIRTYGCKK